MSVTDAWPGLISTALVGSARRRVDDWPDESVRPRDDIDQETRLLDAAALAQAARHAGRLDAVALTALRAAPIDTSSEPGPRAIQLLELVLMQSPAGPSLRPTLLMAWCERARAGGCRVPAHLLPAVLQALEKASPDLRESVHSVLGERGRWLVRALVDASDEADAADGDDGGAVDSASWPTLPTDRRVAVLRRLRATEPETGLRLLMSTWAREPARDRVALLSALDVGVSPADEPFLEEALDDRAATVRTGAAQLLDRVPTSRRAARMAARLAPLLGTRGLLKRTLTIARPEEPDEAAVRDGITTPPHGSRRDAWLTQIIGSAPLATWDAVGGPSAASRTDDAAVRAGWVTAAVNQRDTAWATALMSSDPTPALFDVLAPHEREQWAIRLLVDPEQNWVASIADRIPAPWSTALSKAAYDAIRRDKLPHVAAAPEFVAAFDPALAAQLSRDDSSDPTLTKALATIVTFHSVRRSIQEAFT